MRVRSAGLVLLLLAGCSKTPDGGAGEPDIAGKAAAAGVAFTYAYVLAMPRASIAALQESHAAACEALGPARCRITGMQYRVGSSGQIDASLSVALASSVARRFGRDAVQAAERAGATLTGADITGTDTMAAAIDSERVAAESAGDTREASADLARTDLPAAERAQIRAERTAAAARAREAAASGAAARNAVAIAPMRFDYRTGRGTGLLNRLGDTVDLAGESATTTLLALLYAVALAGPPLLALLVLYLPWRRWGKPRWDRVTGE